MDTTNPFKWRHFQAEIILLFVLWYLRYPLSYQDLEEILRERGHAVSYANKHRADGHVEPILPEPDMFCKRQNGSGHHHDP